VVIGIGLSLSDSWQARVNLVLNGVKGAPGDKYGPAKLVLFVIKSQKKEIDSWPRNKKDLYYLPAIRCEGFGGSWHYGELGAGSDSTSI